MEQVTLTNMCMIYNGNAVLVQDRINPNWSGITFPGGHVEPGESFTDAVIREVWEETGLIISVPRLCGIKSWPKSDGSRYIVLFYKTDRLSGELRSSPEGEVFWATFEALPSLRLAKDMDDMLKVFLDDDLSEFYYFKENGQWNYALK